MYVERLKVGGLYTTEKYRSEGIELFKEAHYRYATENMYTDNILLQEEYFVLLEKKSMPIDLSVCLKILTLNGVIGWTTELHRDRRFNPVRFKAIAE